jgi:hypothetical protein
MCAHRYMCMYAPVPTAVAVHIHICKQQATSQVLTYLPTYLHVQIYTQNDVLYTVYIYTRARAQTPYMTHVTPVLRSQQLSRHAPKLMYTLGGIEENYRIRFSPHV